MINYRWLCIICFIVLWSCNDKDVINSSQEDNATVVYFTSPSLSKAEITTRGNFGDVGDAEADKVKSLYLLLFDAQEKLIDFFPCTLGTAGKASVVLKNYTNVRVRLLANNTPTDSWVGTSWSSIQSGVKYSLNLSGSSDYPMTADVGNMNINNSTQFGTSTSPIQLIRSFAQVFIQNSSSSLFQLEGFRLFNIRNEGFVFPQSTLSNVPNTLLKNEAVDAYSNSKTVSYLPETKLEGIEQGKETFLMLKGEYKGVSGYYRIDFKKGDKVDLIDIKRNYKYVIKVNSIKYGYATEDEAKKYPINDDVVTIEELPAYAHDIDVDADGHYFAWTNSTVYIYGKDKYYKKGFEGTLESYPYVLTIAESQDPSLSSNDLEFIDNPISATWVALPGQSKNRYALVADATKLVSETPYTVRVRYKDLVKEIKVVQYENDYIDCTYGTLRIGARDGSEKYVSAYISPYVDAKGNEFSNTNWSGLAQFAATTENCDESSTLAQRMDVVNANKDLFLQYRENFNPEKMGIEAKNYDYEGYRFVNIFSTAVNGGGRVKTIVAQPNADLVGFFGRKNLVDATKSDNGDQYESYLAVQRKTTAVLNSSSINTATICDAMNPKGKKLWYMPSNRQLKGLWISDQSNSRQTSTFKTSNLNSRVYRYVARKDYTAAMEQDYARPSLWGGSSVGYDLNSPVNLPKMNFTNGETSRSSSSVGNGVRCVRNIDNSTLPLSVRNNSRTPVVNGTAITMDPSGYLTDDYFGEVTNRINPVSRKIELIGNETGTMNVVEYYWTDDADSEFIRSGFWPRFKYTWTKTAGFQHSGLNRFIRKDPNPSYTVSSSDEYRQEATNGSTPIPVEYTLLEAYERCTGTKRLPTARELELLYIYHNLLSEKMYFEKADGYYVGATADDTSRTPNKYYYKMLRYDYDVQNNEPYLYWYWSSTQRNADGIGLDNFKGIDTGTTIPHRVNFVLGDVNARGRDEQKSGKDMYRCVRSIK